MTASSMTSARTATTSPRRATGGLAHPLGPDSLTWKYFGDLRTGMLGVWIGAIQNMYPELGAGVEDHSILLREPLQRDESADGRDTAHPEVEPRTSPDPPEEHLVDEVFEVGHVFLDVL